VRSGSISRPRYVLQFGHISCERFGWWQCGQTLRRGAWMPWFARRLSRRAFEVFRFGTAIRPRSIATGYASPGMSYSIVHVDEIEGAGPGGAVRFVRRQLGVEAFGINWFELPPGAEGHEHDEVESGQEEVNVVVRGSGSWRVAGEDVPVRVGSFLRFDPETTRCPVAGPDGMTFIGIGARPGSYEARGPF
jgi:mannose-6-phosphate isomerase-like protein (cupin superfamily)